MKIISVAKVAYIHRYCKHVQCCRFAASLSLRTWDRASSGRKHDLGYTGTLVVQTQFDTAVEPCLNRFNLD